MNNAEIAEEDAVRSGPRVVLLVLMVGGFGVVAVAFLLLRGNEPDFVEVPITPRQGGTAELAGVAVRIPPGAVSKRATLRLARVDAKRVVNAFAGLATPRGTPVRISIDRDLRRAATLHFSASSGRREVPSIVGRAERPAGPWHAYPSMSDGDSQVARTKRFSLWGEFVWTARKAGRQAKEAILSLWDVDTPNPGCRDPDGTRVTVKPKRGDPALWACLERAGTGLGLQLLSNSNVALSIGVPPGWEVVSQSGASLHEGFWSAVDSSLGGPKLLPAGGELTLRSDQLAGATFSLAANNAAIASEAAMAAMSAGKGSAKDLTSLSLSAEAVSDCAKEVGNQISTGSDPRTIKDTLASCAGVKSLGLPFELARIVAASGYDMIVGNYEGLTDKANGEIVVSVAPHDPTPAPRASEDLSAPSKDQSDDTQSIKVGSTFDSSCVVAWPTAPQRDSYTIQMAMDCAGVPSGYLLTQVVYGDPDFHVTPSTGAMRVLGHVIDVSESDLGYRLLVVEAEQINVD